MLTEGEYEDVTERYPDTPDQIKMLRQQFQDFADMVQRQIGELRRDVDAVTKGVLVTAGALSGKPSAGSGSGDQGSKWEQIKRRLQPRLADAIDVLILQGSMSGTQLAAAMRMDRSNCSKNVVSVLLRQGLIVRNGHELSLKQL